MTIQKCLFAAMLFSAGCVGVGQEGQESTEPQVADNGLVTLVTLRGDLPPLLSEERIPRRPNPVTEAAQLDHDGVGEAQQAVITQSTTCDTSPCLWIYDATGYSGHYTVITGTGSASLSSFTRYCIPGVFCYHWQGAIRSFQTNLQGFQKPTGYLSESGVCSEFYYWSESESPASTCVQAADTVSMM